MTQNAGERRAPCMRILMLSIVNPAVESNGASTVTRGLLELLSTPPLQAHVDLLPARLQPVRSHLLHQARSVFRSAFSRLPSKAEFQYSESFRHRVQAQLRSQTYDLIILNGADLLWIASSLPPSIPRVLIAHNIEHQLFRIQLQHYGLPLRAALRRDATRLQDYELSGMRHAVNVLFLSDADAAYANRLCDGLHWLVMPPVFTYEPAVRKRGMPGPTLELGLMGNFNWWPNQRMVHWFASQVLPYVTSPLRLNLFGRPSGGLSRDPRIVQHGVVAPVEEVFNRCDFLICPGLPTGGVSVKIAESLYNGMPVLATREAVRGLPLEEDSAVAIRDGAREWIQFLNSERARHLAVQQVSAANKRNFAPDGHLENLHLFIANATHPR